MDDQSPFVDAAALEGQPMAQPLNDAEFKVEVIKQLSLLQQEMQDLTGNGQPGRMGLAEQKLRWISAGMGILLGAGFMGTVGFLYHLAQMGGK